MNISAWMEPLGAICGLAGSFLLARNDARSGWGFVVYLASNIAWTVFAVLQQHWWLLAQYIGFTAVSFYGVYRWLLAPRPPAPPAPTAGTPG